MISDSLYQVNNLRELIEKSADANGEKIAFCEKKNRKVVNYSYNNMKEDVFSLTYNLMTMGLKGSHIAILSENSYKWIISFLAITNGVGVAVPLDKELGTDLLEELIIKSDIEAIIFSKAFAKQIEELAKRCPGVSRYICMEKCEDKYLDIDTILEECRPIKNKELIFDEINTDKLSVIIFTSGTTGANKGVMLSQDNILANISVGSELFNGFKRTIAVLPFNHVYENVCGILVPINLGMTVFINDSLKYLSKNIKEFKPDSVLLVPLFLETMYKNIQNQLLRQGIKRYFEFLVKISNFLLTIGIDKREKFFKVIKDSFGGNLQKIICGGAILKPELVKKFQAFGIDVINGFGITECAPLVSVNTKAKKTYNSVGQVVPCSDVKIYHANTEGIGEILVKGKNVMLGYYKDEVSTKKTFVDDWFRTGDLGYLDKNNNLYITGRVKNLIVLSNGKNVHPEELEGYIYQKMPYVQEAIVYTQKNSKGTEVINAYVYLNNDYLKINNVHNPEIMLKNDLLKLNKDLPAFKQIQHIFIKPEEFEKNASKKIIRYKFLKEIVKNG